MAGPRKGKKKKSKGKSNNARKSDYRQDGISGSNFDSMLEEVLLQRVEIIYQKALEKLVELGYGVDVAVKAILMNGSIFGGVNILSNILSNALVAIEKGHVTDGKIEVKPIFEDVHELARFSMQTLINIIGQDRSDMEKVDAILFLLESKSLEVHVSSGDPSHSEDHENLDHKNASEIDIGKMLMENTACLQTLSISSTNPSSLSSTRGVDTCVSETPINNQQTLRGKSSTNDFELDNSDFLKTLANCPGDRSFEECIRTYSEDSMDDLILTTAKQVENLTQQVKERRERAKKKVIQAASEFNATNIELADLRLDKDETDRLLKQKEEFDLHNSMLKERENNLRKVKHDLDSANQVSKGVAAQNQEIKAEILAYNLSTSETEKSLLEVQKRQRKTIKKCNDSEKHVDDLKRKIAEEKRKLTEMEERMQQVNEAQKQAELRLSQEEEAKVQAHALLLEEKRLNRLEKENSKRRLAPVRQELDMNYRQMMDYQNRLELELSQLKAAECSSNASSIFPAATSTQSRPHRNIRQCIICSNTEVSILFLPCAHQVICPDCNEEVYDALEDQCPCCKARIEKRVKVYGPST